MLSPDDEKAEEMKEEKKKPSQQLVAWDTQYRIKYNKEVGKLMQSFVHLVRAEARKLPAVVSYAIVGKTDPKVFAQSIVKQIVTQFVQPPPKSPAVADRQQKLPLEESPPPRNEPVDGRA